MGGLVWRAGDYEMSIMDYEYPEEYDEDGKELEIDPNHIFNVKIINLLKGSEKEKQVELKYLYSLDENNHFEGYGKETKDPLDWLFEQVKATAGVKIIPSVNQRCSTKESRQSPEYYLQSDIGDDNVILGTEPRMFLLEDRSQGKWLAAKNLGYCLRKSRIDYLKERGV